MLTDLKVTLTTLKTPEKVLWQNIIVCFCTNLHDYQLPINLTPFKYWMLQNMFIDILTTFYVKTLSLSLSLSALISKHTTFSRRTGMKIVKLLLFWNLSFLDTLLEPPILFPCRSLNTFVTLYLCVNRGDAGDTTFYLNQY